MTPDPIAARTNLIRAIVKALRLPPNAPMTNGLLKLDLGELEHGIVTQDGVLRFKSDPTTVIIHRYLTVETEDAGLSYVETQADTTAAADQSLRLYYRNTGCTLADYLTEFPR